MPEPLSPEDLEAIWQSAAKVVEMFGDDWELLYNGCDVSCRTDQDVPFEGAYVEIFNTSQWLDGSPDSPVAEFLSASIVVIPRLLAEAERLQGFTRRATDRVNELGQLRDAVSSQGNTVRAERLSFAMQEIRDLFKPAPEAEGQ